MFANILNNLPAALQHPATQMGLQMLAAGGPQQQHISFGQRLAQAGQGFANQQMQQADLARQQQLQQLRQMQLQQMQGQAASAEDLKRKLQDPQFAASLTPHAQRLAQAGASPEQIFDVYRLESQVEHQNRQLQALEQYRQAQLGIQQQRADAYVQRQGQLGQGTGGAPAAPRAPAPRQIIEEPLPDGRVQRYQWDYQSGGYVPFGAPYQRGQGNDLLGQILGGAGGVPQAEQQAEQQASPPWAGLPTGGGRGAPPVQQQAPQQAPQQVPTDIELNEFGIPVPTGHAPAQRPAPLAAGGGGQAREQAARSDFERDLAQALQVLQMNPGARAEIDRRLREKYGKGL